MTTTTSTVLVVDDDDALAEMIGIVLAQEGYNAVFCENGSRAFETFMRHSPDLVLLDLMLPGKSGIEVCEQIRSSSNVPIIMLTAKSDTEDVVKGLEAGADDYIAKPFKHLELMARIRARLRPRESRQLVVRVGDTIMDMDGRTLKYKGVEVPMTPFRDCLGLQRCERFFGKRSRAASSREVYGYWCRTGYPNGARRRI